MICSKAQSLHKPGLIIMTLRGWELEIMAELRLFREFGKELGVSATSFVTSLRSAATGEFISRFFSVFANLEYLVLLS